MSNTFENPAITTAIGVENLDLDDGTTAIERDGGLRRTAAAIATIITRVHEGSETGTPAVQLPYQVDSQLA